MALVDPAGWEPGPRAYFEGRPADLHATGAVLFMTWGRPRLTVVRTVGALPVPARAGRGDSTGAFARLSRWLLGR